MVVARAAVVMEAGVMGAVKEAVVWGVEQVKEGRGVVLVALAETLAGPAAAAAMAAWLEEVGATHGCHSTHH